VHKGVAGIIVAWAIGVLVLTGCGGGDSSAASPTNAAFLKEANEICLQYEKKRNNAMIEVRANGGNMPAPEYQMKVLATSTAGFKRMTDRLAKLEPPEGRDEQFARIIQGFEKGIELSEAEPAAVFHGAVVYEEAEQAVAAFGGLKDCIGGF
jgi:hypothetical protein